MTRIERKKKTITKITLLLCSLLPVSCSTQREVTLRDTKQGHSLVILHDNDVHCAIDGYCRLAGLRNAIVAADTADVLVVSSGDFINGGTVGTLSKGMDIITLMNAVGYDASCLGNHAFAFGNERMNELVKAAHLTCVAANYTYADTDQPVFQPSVIKRAGEKKVAFIGCTTATVMESCRSCMYDREGKLLYKMLGPGLTERIQREVDAVRSAGADYVILLSHLGEDPSDSEWTSLRVIGETEGIDAVFDGHTHNVFADSLVANVRGIKVHATQTGALFANVGKMWISADGKHRCTSLIPTSEIPYTDLKVKHLSDSINHGSAVYCSEVIGHTDYEMIVGTPADRDYIRAHETNFGDLVTDAYVWGTGAQIAIEQSSSIRNNLHVGTLTRGDIINAQIYANTVRKYEVTGQRIIDYLTAANDQMPVAKGKFPQVSGIRYTIDLTGSSPALSEVQVLDPVSGQYTDINHEARYTVALSDYCARTYAEILGGCQPMADSPSLLDQEYTIHYLQEKLRGVIPAIYALPQGRICIRK